MANTNTIKRRSALGVLSSLAVGACSSEGDDTPGEPILGEASALSATDPRRTWVPVTGFLVDIATGNGPSSRWGIDTNVRDGGFQVVRWSGSSWVGTSGGAVRIALRGHGYRRLPFVADSFLPWVVTKQGRIFRAMNSVGSAWQQLPDLPGTTAVDVGSSPNASTWPDRSMNMWAVGADGRLFSWSDDNHRWFPELSAPPEVERVSSGPLAVSPETTPLLVLTRNGDVWWGDIGGFARVNLQPDRLRTDVAAGSLLREGFFKSIVATSFSVGNEVATYRPADASGPAAWFGTGPYASFGRPIPIGPLAVSSDFDRARVWIVTGNDNRVFYGE